MTRSNDALQEALRYIEGAKGYAAIHEPNLLGDLSAIKMCIVRALSTTPASAPSARDNQEELKRKLHHIIFVPRILDASRGMTSVIPHAHQIWDEMCKALAASLPSESAANIPAKPRFDEYVGTDEVSPLERLRFFCSLAMDGQDWTDAEPFFDALEAQLAAPSPDVGEEKQR